MHRNHATPPGIAVATIALALSGAVVAGLLGGCSRASAPSGASSTATTSTPTAALKPMRPGTVAPPANGAYVGVFMPPAPYDRTKLDSYASLSGKPVAIVMWYQQWGGHGANKFDPAMVASVYARGAVPLISWEPWDPGSKPHNIKNPADSPEWNLKSISSGAHDAYLLSWAQGIKALGGPVMLRPMHEMNGNWYPWAGKVNGNSPADYIAAWRHVHDLFAEQGVTNVTWVWSVNCNSKPYTPDNAAAVYYPGDQYVDWVAISGFNAGPNKFGQPGPTFDQLFATQIAYLSTLGKPIAIGETACVQAAPEKPEWIANAYNQVATKYPQIKAIVYYNAREKSVKFGLQDWRINSSAASQKAYSDAVAGTHFVGGPMPALSQWEQGLSAAQLKKLASYPKLY